MESEGKSAKRVLRKSSSSFLIIKKLDKLQFTFDFKLGQNNGYLVERLYNFKVYSKLKNNV